MKKLKNWKKKKIHQQDNLFNVSISPLIFNGITGAIIRLDDITEIEQKDEQLRQSQKMETIGTLAGGIAHDFNNILGGITGTVSILKYKMQKYGQLTNKKIDSYLDIINESSNRAADIVQQLLSLSRKQEINFAPEDVNKIIGNVMNICKNSFDKCIKLEPEYLEITPVINADSSQIEQVILNLCINASHAMTIMRGKNENHGGLLKINIERLKPDHHFIARKPEAQQIDYWKISIQDNGIGMDTTTAAKIFDPFFSTKDKGKGTGLGLSMVYNIVRQHKGFIDVYSEPGIGSTFTLYFPVLDTEIVKNQSKDINLLFGKGLVLVIDDEEVMRDLATDILKECKYDVITAKNGIEGIKIFKERENEVSVILLDMVMPEKSGFDTYLELKEIKTDVKVILSSGFIKDKRVQTIIEQGVNAFIHKPYTIDKLSKTVYEVIQSDLPLQDN